MGITLTIDQAKGLIDAFGSCTAVYECTEPKEMVERAAEFDGDLEAFVKLELQCEGIFWERYTEANSLGGEMWPTEQELEAHHEELSTWETNIKERVTRWFRAQIEAT